MFGRLLIIAVAVAGIVGCGGWRVAHSVPLRTDATGADVQRKIRIVFIGDVMVHTPQVVKAYNGSGYDFTPTFRYVAPIFESADLVVANLETTLSENPPYSGYPQFCSPASLADAMKKAGVDVVVTANNHSLDCGAAGVRRTLRILEQRGIAHTGSFADSIDLLTHNPLIIDCAGVRLAILNYTYGTNGIVERGGVVVNRIDTTAIGHDIACAAHADCIVAYMHWGDEYARRENAEQRQIADFLHRHGVHAVIGSHPHVVQPYEQSDSRITVYSLGNFVSNQRKRYCDGGLIATLEIAFDDGKATYSPAFMPVWVRKSDYAVIPKCVGDTMAMSRADSIAYAVFMADTEDVLAQ